MITEIRNNPFRIAGRRRSDPERTEAAAAQWRVQSRRQVAPPAEESEADHCDGLLTGPCPGAIPVVTRPDMGLADRDYQREHRPGGGGFLAILPPVTKWLLIVNVVIFVLDYWVLNVNGDPYPPIIRWGAFAIRSAIFEGRVWEFLTFQFLHGGFLHVLFNSIALFFFGPFMERWLGARKFLVYYLLCGVGGAVFFTLLVFARVLPDSPLVGASAGIYGILIGVAVIAPALRVRLLIPPIELSMRQLAIALLVMATVFVIGGRLFPGVSLFWNAGGEAGHLGGAIAGFLLLRFPKALAWVDRPRTPEARRSPRRGDGPKLRPRPNLRGDDEVDRILDKISKDGFQSLDENEKEILRRASQQQQNDS